MIFLTHIYMKRIFFLFLLFTFISTNVKAINLRVGDTKDLDIGMVSHLQGCQWTISRPNDVIFITTPQSYSTRVTIKAIKSFPATSPCVVQCKYYYLELDPTTGKYIYSRTGYKDWTIFVSKDENSSGSSGSTSNKNDQIYLEKQEISIFSIESTYLSSNINSGETLYWSIDNPKIAYLYEEKYNKICIYGKCPGTTYVRVKRSSGPEAICKVTVKLKSEYKKDEKFYYCDNNNVSVIYQVNSDTKKTCTLAGYGEYSERSNFTTKELVLPQSVNGYTITIIGNSAFEGYTSLTSIIIPQEVQYIDQNIFEGCPIKSIICHSPNIKFNSYAISKELIKNVILYVPKYDNNFRQFYNIIELENPFNDLDISSQEIKKRFNSTKETVNKFLNTLQ